tara:strand:- start:247 stop:438 length:192 start_codon:yes stop_codon:yes gene_type:complete
MTIYKEAKEKLRSYAEWVKVRFETDKPAIRMGINDHHDSLCKDLDLTEYQRGLLANYACTLHP